MRKGEIGFPHLVQMSHTASAVRRACARSDAFDEDKLLERARTESVGRFWHTCQNYLHACNPDVFADRAETVFEQRELTIRRRRDGAYTFWGRLDPLGAAVVKASLAPLARKRGKEGDRSFKQRLHDALVEHAAENQQTHLSGRSPRLAGVRSPGSHRSPRPVLEPGRRQRPPQPSLGLLPPPSAAA